MEKIERIISIFDKKNGGLLSEINIDNIPLPVLKDIFMPPDDDHLMIDPQIIKKKHIKSLIPYLEKSMVFDFKSFVYSVDCFKIDD
ncbi:DUF7683 domain-containing protein [Dyadobacter pollutisoli]|uniref:DUF7683 domain-containing protein n=1 Tax=Dyadobacter pollutisoli TaxID=2910158 RepID=A0A9E8NGS8_9BACT|nr:hypothetical protein [Dyadobacter pollutisoli]WAC13779.1 hypothetical protein ON006_07420 [Dyadobacter pollutisoli]